jgi:hypothetical protein
MADRRPHSRISPKKGSSLAATKALAALDGRSREAVFINAVRGELLADAGPDPSAGRRALIDLAAYSLLMTARLTAKVSAADDIDPLLSGELRSWQAEARSNIKTIGLERVAAPERSLHEYLGQLADEPTAPEPDPKTCASARAPGKPARGRAEAGSSRPTPARPSAPAARRRAGLPSAPPGPPVPTPPEAAIEDVGAL